MDFKIAGTRGAITAIQLDVKLPIPLSILCEALEPAQVARGKILDVMEAEVREPRSEQRENSPRTGELSPLLFSFSSIFFSKFGYLLVSFLACSLLISGTMALEKESIGRIIGPSGTTIKSIQNKSGWTFFTILAFFL